MLLIPESTTVSTLQPAFVTFAKIASIRAAGEKFDFTH
jgi:hypothetical protein